MAPPRAAWGGLISREVRRGFALKGCIPPVMDGEVLRELLRERSADGRRRVVPLLGSGINMAGGGRDEGWEELLAELEGDEPAPAGLDATLRFERIVRRHQQLGNEQASAVEVRLCRRVAKHLGGRPPGEAHRLVSEAGFRDILTINFDLRLHGTGPARPRGGQRRFPLDRRFVLANGTRVWHLHGDLRRPAAILLGLRAYGAYLSRLEATWHGLRSDDRRRNRCPSDEPDEDPGSWLAAAHRSPLVILGCGLRSVEWPLWWWLIQRGRAHARHPAAPPVVYVTATADRGLDTLANRLAAAGILISTPVDGFADLWPWLAEALAA